MLRQIYQDLECMYIQQNYISRMKVLVSHVQTLCDPMDYSLPGSSVHEIVQARILETLVPRLVLATSSVTLPIAIHFLYSFFFGV